MLACVCLSLKLTLSDLPQCNKHSSEVICGAVFVNGVNTIPRRYHLGGPRVSPLPVDAVYVNTLKCNGYRASATCWLIYLLNEIIGSKIYCMFAKFYFNVCA